MFATSVTQVSTEVVGMYRKRNIVVIEGYGEHGILKNKELRIAMSSTERELRE